MSGVAAILRYPLPGIDDIEEEDIDIDEMIEETGEEDSEEKKEEESKTEKKKLTFDEEQLELLLK